MECCSALHYQFEAIHPFTDGNGRTGRILNLLVLLEHKLLSLPVLYLSRYIIHHRAEYYRRLQAVTSEGDWESWILFMVNAVAETSRRTANKIHAIQQLRQVTKDHLRHVLPKIYSHELLDILFTRPYSRIANLVDAQIAKRQTASTHLKALVEARVLKEIGAGRQKIFLHTKLMDLLSDESNEIKPYRQRARPF